jgi:hypothetical protein
MTFMRCTTRVPSVIENSNLVDVISGGSLQIG